MKMGLLIKHVNSLLTVLWQCPGKEGKSKKRKRPPAAAQGLTIVDMDASGFVNKPEKLARKKVDLSKYMLQGGDENDDDDDDKDDDGANSYCPVSAK